MKNNRGFFGPLLIIFVGIVFLLNNFNLLPWSSWDLFFKLWPVVLVVIGLEILLEGTRWARYMVGLVLLLLVLFLASQVLMWNNVQLRGWVNKHMPWMPSGGNSVFFPQPQLPFFDNGGGSTL